MTIDAQILSITLLVSVFIGVILIFFLSAVVYYHRQYLKMQKERIHAEITIQENERKRIATDLHDSLGPLLSSVKLNINSIDVDSSADKEIIAKAGKHIDEIIKGLRQISNNLLPNTLDRKGLAEALKEFASQMNSKNAMAIEVQCIETPSLAKDKEIHVFRMIQEIVNNAIKHAGARQLKIGMGKEDKALLILTKDDGKGFDVIKAKANPAGLGLKSLESRIEILNGHMVIESEPGKGTVHFIKIPLDANQ